MTDSEDSPTPAKVAKLSSSITEISSEPEPSFVDAETQKALEDIDNCQNDIDVLNEKASEEILQVEMKYNKLRRPHFEKRNNLIKHIPNFWVTSFLNHPRMANIVEEEEEECLHYLKQVCKQLGFQSECANIKVDLDPCLLQNSKVDVEEFEDIKSGYTIHFQFAPNPYFADEVLTKEFHLAAIDGKPACRSTEIHWRSNMDLTKSTHAKNMRRQRGEGRSFFSWLTENIDPARDRIADMIKDDLWPNPLQYYLASDIEVEENGIDSEDDNNVIEDDSVVIVGDDDDSDELEDDDDVYEVKDDDDEEDDDLSGEELEETVESIEVEDDDEEDDDEDAIEVLGSDSEAELLQDTSEISHDPNSSHAETKTNEDDVTETSQDSVADEPDTSQTNDGELEKDVSESDKAVTENDDSVLGLDNTSQNDESVLDNDGNDSDLLKEDDEDEETGLEKKDLSGMETAQTSVSDGGERTEDGVD